MSTFSGLEIGKRGLLAQRLGLDVTSNNIANVNTPGYSRRTVQMAETAPQRTYGGFVGTGVVVDTMKSYRDEFFDREIRSSISRNSTLESDELIYDRMEAIFAEPSELGLNELAADFFNAFEDVANNPENEAIRENAVSAGVSLAHRINYTAENLEEFRKEIHGDIKADLVDINEMLNRVAKLNKEISSQYSLEEAGAQTMIDEREQILEEISQLAGITVSADDYGTVNVFINGINVVTNTTVTPLELKEVVNATTGEIGMKLTATDERGVTRSINPQSGELYSYLKHYNETLDPVDSSGNFSMYTRLNEFVDTLAKTVNDLTMTGYGLDDTTAEGRAFFEPTVGTVTARTISVNDEIVKDSRKLPVADVPNEPGNNNIARQLSRISEDATFIRDTTPGEYITQLIGRAGQLAAEAEKGNETTALVTEQFKSQRESVMGVNLDEEAINLIKYQNAFEAASRVVNVTNDILQTLIMMGR